VAHRGIRRQLYPRAKHEARERDRSRATGATFRDARNAIRHYGVGLGSLGGVSLGGMSDGGGVSDGGISDGGGVALGSVGVPGVVMPGDVVSSGGGAVPSGSFRAQPAIRNAAVNNANRARMKVSLWASDEQWPSAKQLCCRRITASPEAGDP